jgi:hypothetical protein
VQCGGSVKINVSGLVGAATRFYDWHNGKITIPGGGQVVGSAVETDISLWDDYDGPVPEADTDTTHPTGFIRVIMYKVQKWDDAQNDEVPDLATL